MKTTKLFSIRLLLLALMITFLLPSQAGSLEEGFSAYDKGDYSSAFKHFSKAAKQGNAEAQFFLGNMYANGDVPRATGEGVPKDAGEGVPKDDIEALKLSLDVMRQEWRQREAEALKWYRKAAEQGNAKMQFKLGIMCANGTGVPKDDVEAVKWYRKGAEQGIAEAQYNLGNKYAKGEGVPKDEVEAYKWFNLSAAQGYSRASSNRDVASKRMTREQIAKGQEHSREWKPKR